MIVVQQVPDALKNSSILPVCCVDVKRQAIRFGIVFARHGIWFTLSRVVAFFHFPDIPS